jgi:hypothetical protein
MKAITRIVGAAVVLSMIFTASCKDDPPSAEEVFMSKLSRKWKLSSIGVKLDDQVVNGVFNDFTVTFAKGRTYSTTDGQTPIWKPSGKFTLKAVKNSPNFTIIRDDAMEVTVTELTEAKLVLQFNYISPGGRVNSVSGGYVFDLIPD